MPSLKSSSLPTVPTGQGIKEPTTRLSAYNKIRSKTAGLERNEAPPTATTWRGAAPVLLVCAVFDAVRFVFDWFIIFGPFLVGVGTDALAQAGVQLTSKTIHQYLGTGTGLGSLATGAGHVLAAGAAAASAFFGEEVFAPFGIIMALLVGLLGWLTILVWLMVANPRIFKVNENSIISIILGLAFSETPLIGSLPGITFTIAKMYNTQIKNETKALQQYEGEQVASIRAEQQQRALQLMQVRGMQQMQLENKEDLLQASNDESFEPEEQAAVPAPVRKAA